MAHLTYVLITAARNEEAYIEETIKSVLAQTVKPLKWIIVSDGSTDSTGEIVKRYAAKHAWIELLRMPEHRLRHFGAKADCVNEGCRRVKDLAYDVVGNVDADTSFEADHFEFLLEKFARDPILGVAGTAFVEDGATYDYRGFGASVEHVSGPCQLFRRECFEEIGGYVAIKQGVDLVAVVTARMKGWKTKSFREKTYVHRRTMGTANQNVMVAVFKHGKSDYFLGGHPIWEIVRSVFQMSKRPLILGGCMLLAGYLSAMIQGEKMLVSGELVKFRRREQMNRLKVLIRRWIGINVPEEHPVESPRTVRKGKGVPH